MAQKYVLSFGERASQHFFQSCRDERCKSTVIVEYKIAPTIYKYMHIYFSNA